MTNTVQFLQFLYEKEGLKLESLQAAWQKQNGDPAELEAMLEKFGVKTIGERNQFFWDLQLVIEDSLVNGDYSDHDTLMSIAVEKWNGTCSNGHITPEVVNAFMPIFGYKFPNNQKAFKALCEGDYEGYKIFERDSSLFINLLNRMLVLQASQTKTMNDIVNDVAERLFGVKDTNELFDNSLRSLRFMGRRLIVPKLKKFNSLYSLDDFVFSNGMQKILKDKLGIEISNLDQDYPKKQESAQTNSQNAEQETTAEAVADNGKGPVAVAEVPGTYTSESASDAVKDANVTAAGEDYPDEEAPLEEQGISALLDQEFGRLKETILARFEEGRTAAEQIAGQAQQVAPALEVEASPQYVSALEEENTRLKSELADAELKTRQAVEHTITELVKSIAGRQANYLLSDLYDETNRPDQNNYPTVVGLLINLFSELSMFGLEPYSLGRNVGESFSVSKEDLMKNYMVTAPISSVSNEISVKLVKYGWSNNGKTLVQPLVEEIREER